MRRLSILVLTFLITCVVTANPVTADRAKAIAAGLFGRNTQKSSSTVYLKYTGVCNGDTVYYVFGYADGGFAIISADDAVMPVLGYSRTSPANEVTDNMMLMHQLDRYANKIVSVRGMGVTSPENSRRWRAYADSLPQTDSVPAIDTTQIADTAQVVDTVSVVDSLKTVGPLITSTWGQSGSYNDSCPTIAGCVAVAMGQVMRYHQWPDVGRGWHKYIPAESPSYGRQFVNFGAATYHWNLMPDKLRRHHTEVELSAVAQLLYHVGVSVDMSYTKSGSGSYPSDILYAMPNYFRYSDSIRMCLYSDYSPSDWFNLIKAEIDAGRPVIYSGASGDGAGHAWVVDGYDPKGYLHVNWGWDGDYDGFFLPDRMILETTHYDREIDAIVGIRPSTDTPLLWTLQSSGFTNGYRGIQNISAVNEYVVWASAYDGSFSNGQCMDFCRTIDGGESWQVGTVNVPRSESYSISSISAVSDVEAWATIFVSANSRSLTGGKVAHTTDGGKSWDIQPTAVFNGRSAFPNTVYFWDSQTGVCLGDPNDGYFEIYTTTDGGNQWNRVPSSRIPASKRSEKGLVGSFSVCGNTVFFGTSAGRLFRSVDKGATWTVAQTPLSDNFKLAFRDDDTGLISAISTNKYDVYRTTDGGSGWEKVEPNDRFYISSFAYVPGTDTIVSVGANPDGTVYGLSYSTDFGATFTNYADFYTDISMFTALGIAPNGKGMWAGSLNYSRYYGGMWHRGITEPILKSTPIKSVQANTNENISVYPNPASDVVRIECKETIVSLELLTISGTTVVSKQVDATSCSLSVATLPKGVYIVRANLSGTSAFSRLIVE